MDVGFSAMIALSMLLAVNITMLGLKLLDLSKEEYREFFYVHFIVILMLIGVNYHLTCYKRKYTKIEKRFKKETNERRILGNILVSLYVILTLLSPFFIKI